MPHGITVHTVNTVENNKARRKIASLGIKTMATPSPPMWQPYDTYRNSTDLLVLSKMADGFALTNQNIAGVSTEICSATASVLAGTERQSLNNLNATERNGSDIRLAVERNGNDTRTVVNGNGTASLVSIERNGGDTRQTVVQQAGDVKNAVGDSRSLIQNSVRDSTQVLTQQQSATLAAVERNASENRQTTTTEGATSRIQSAAQFANLAEDVSRVGYENTTAVNAVGTANALAAKDIQIQGLAIKADLALQASNNAANARMDTYQGIKSVQEQLCRSELESFKLKEALAAQMTAQATMLHAAVKNSELEAYKNKEALSQQLHAAEVEAVKNAAAVSKQLSECCCEIKEKVGEAAAATEMLIKKQSEDKLRDDNIIARLGGSGSALAAPFGVPGYPAVPFGFPGAFPVAPYGGYGYGGRGRDRSCSPRRGPPGRDGRDGRDSSRASSPRSRRHE